jgi:Family of unknown function (DUF5681)
MGEVLLIREHLLPTLLPNIWKILKQCAACLSPFLRLLDTTKYALDPTLKRAHKECMGKSFDAEIGAATRWRKGQPSPNPGGRPKSRLLSNALTAKLAEVKPDDAEGRTYAQVIAANLVELAAGKSRSAVVAAAQILDRIEGKPTQQLHVADITSDLASRSDEELQYYLDHGCWPEDAPNRQ